ncbi:uroporphyrinogen decarboxylase family protein [Alkalibacter mobilis]|uniref:uroporphyrinogen decarboxylase family protein n=1 Tax=Alkalibacter mobilis TaxID=2787712 RepID=UPI00189CBC30|nr:uroporphyrinogen decarboxylase family protein [Alkalibacter mobilis]MBF7097432.1 uroporphyrinogen decarboxylase [Alkalibacter mobilis]
MLTIKQNLLETMKGGNPDRFVKQYEFMEMIMNVPIARKRPNIGEEVVNEWGVTFRWPEGQLGSFPVHDEEHILIKDIENWRDYVKAPNVKYSDEDWVPAIEVANAVDRNEKFLTCFVAPGLFEQTHHFMRMENALTAYYEYPDEMHELIDFLVDFELAYAKELIDHLHPECIFHHDDWGGQTSTFLSPEMFEEFFLEPYKKIYGFYKDNGVELIVHHSDSYAASLVPYMIEMGIDIWQGVMTSNNTPELIKKYGGKITFMGDLDSGVIDFPEWTPEIVAEEVERACRNCGKHYFIPCLTQGLGFSSFPGVYDKTNEEIDKMSEKMF